MELFLNLAWVIVAAVIVCLWLQGEKGGNSSNPNRRRQLIAIAVLIAILFPVISVSDDLMVLQSASEADNYLRRDHLVFPDIHPVQPMLAFMAPAIFGGLSFGFLRFVAPCHLPVQKPQHPELAGIDNRPPPAA